MSSRTHVEGEAQLDESWTDVDLRSILPVPAPDAHKYSRGVLAVVAGSERYSGAALLAALAGQSMGAGYTELYTTETARGLALSARPSLVVRARDAFDPAFSEGRSAEGRRAVCIGPGFEPDDKDTGALVVATLARAACPVLVDGGALSRLGKKKALKALAERRERGWKTVVTPHVGEARRLARDICLSSDDPVQLARALALSLGSVVVLKGADTFISNGMLAYPMREGSAVLAKAGTGDVLAGMISSLLAQGLPPLEAAVLGSTLHARAGNAAAEARTAICATPEDVIDSIPAAVKSLLR